jgi:hypothetical protein
VQKNSHALDVVLLQFPSRVPGGRLLADACRRLAQLRGWHVEQAWVLQQALFVRSCIAKVRTLARKWIGHCASRVPHCGTVWHVLCTQCRPAWFGRQEADAANPAESVNIAAEYEGARATCQARQVLELRGRSTILHVHNSKMWLPLCRRRSYALIKLRHSPTQFRHSLTQFCHSLTQFRHSLTQFRHSLTQFRHSLTQFRHYI